MVAMGAEEEEERRLDERRMHQGCMAGFFHLFDRPQILSGKRLHHQPRRLLSSSSGSATPSERSMQLDRSPERATPLPSPDMTPPAAPRPSLQLPPMDMKDGGGAPAVWRLPRLSLDSRAVVDARGKLRPREIRTSPVAPPSPGAGGDERRSPSVVARLMGLDALPHGAAGDEQAAPCGGELRRSASERVPREPACFRFVDPSFFEKPSPPVTPQQRPSSPGAEAAALRRAPDPACPRGLQRRSRFDAHDVFPEPAKRVDSVAAGHGEIALYGEIERRLRKRGIAEPARDLETLKQILEALQLKGLLRHTQPPPVSSVLNQPPPPIVVMRPSSRPPQPPASRTSPTRRIRVDVDNARRPRSPDRAASPARSPASPSRRGPQSPQRRLSPAQSPRYQPPLRKPSTGDAAGVRSRIARRAGHSTAALTPDDDASTTFSDGGSSGSLSASSRWDFEQRARPDELRTDRGLLERCGKLLSSIQAFTAGDDQQPSPVSVLDAAAFLADEDSPSSSGSKRAIFFGAPSPRAATVSDPEDDEWGHPDTWTVGPEAASDPDYAYVAEVVKLFDRMRDPSDVYTAAEKTTRGDGDTCHHRRLLCLAAAEALDRRRSTCAWDPVAWLRGGELVDHVWAEVKRCREPVAPPDADLDLNELIRGGVVRDLAADHVRWPPQRLPGAEVGDAVLQIERLVFKDLVADTIRELADVDRRLPRRKLVF
ncbi:hypothetical protein E2562_029566 [Oryza meyeriana var. granulata]|uniref:DUF4378 domain-containing protein n=1 Tax=Oryza meyeriana var. granulata TaxID=110450 RepID=A0A6G1C9W2_9ORYZ|nr:hypothetical protein E2562_029566 [Oryza meyeriana var. granulata]